MTAFLLAGQLHRIQKMTLHRLLILSLTFGLSSSLMALEISVDGCLNLRSKPNAKSARHTCINDGVRVTPTGTVRGNWIQVSHGGQTGWVYNKYTKASVRAHVLPRVKPIRSARDSRAITFEDLALASPEEVPSATRPEHQVVIQPASYVVPSPAAEPQQPVEPEVQIGTEPVTQSDVSAQPEVQITVPQATAPQSEVQIPQLPQAQPETGLTLPQSETPVAPSLESAEAALPSASVPRPMFKPNRFVRVNTASDGLNFWANPGGAASNSGRLGVIRKGAEVRVIGAAKGDWIPVQVGGVKGYVHKDYLAESTEAAFVECDGSTECKKGLLQDLRAVAASTGGFIHPVPNLTRVSSNFGMRKHPLLGYNRLHGGIDFAAPAGTPILAAASGKVIYSKYTAAEGYMVKIDHGNGFVTVYMHMQKSCSRPAVNSRVVQGVQIGCVGSTGLSSGPHLHFEIRKNGNKMDPREFHLAK